MFYEYCGGFCVVLVSVFFLWNERNLNWYFGVVWCLLFYGRKI